MMSVRLVPFSVAALEAEAQSIESLCAALAVQAPSDWPPPFGDAEVREWFRRQLLADPSRGPWLGYYVVAQIDGHDTFVGTAGYKGPPGEAGEVEIGYSIVPAYHRQGIGTAMVTLLCSQAFGDARIVRVRAETPIQFASSRGLLEKCGFRLAGHKHDPDDGELAVYVVDREAVSGGS